MKDGTTRLLRQWVLAVKDWHGIKSHSAEIKSLIAALNKSQEFELVTGPDNMWESDSEPNDS